MEDQQREYIQWWVRPLCPRSMFSNSHVGCVEGLQDVDDVLGSFASSCLAAGPNCTLNVKHNLPSTSALLSKIDATLDTLYRKPVPVYGMDVPAVATAYNLRTLMFQSMYNIRTWDALAERLSEAFEGNFTQIADRTLPRVPPDGGRRSDSSAYPGSAVMVCSFV